MAVVDNWLGGGPATFKGVKACTCTPEYRSPRRVAAYVGDVECNRCKGLIGANEAMEARDVTLEQQHAAKVQGREEQRTVKVEPNYEFIGDLETLGVCVSIPISELRNLMRDFRETKIQLGQVRERNARLESQLSLIREKVEGR